MTPPNIIFIMSDDHAAQAVSAYGGPLNRTPHIDRIAATGIRCDQVFCTNSICAPSRAAILTGTWNHINGVRTLHDRFDGRQDTIAKRLQARGYQTALFGKWHLGHGGEADPTGFDAWQVVPGQGEYWNPPMLTAGGRVTVTGYATDIITDLSLAWLAARDRSRPFALMLHHKAPHRPWEFHPRHATLYPEGTIPEPDAATFWDDHAGHGPAAKAARMTMFDLHGMDLGEARPPAGISREDEQRWRYQRFMARYLRCVQAVDEGVGRVLDWLEAGGLREHTIVVYTSDQGFFLGEHGWFDKRFMYEESLRMPFLISAPGLLPQGVVNDDLLLNVDVAPTFAAWAGAEPPHGCQGRSFAACLAGRTPADWRSSFYYRYWMHKDGAHHVWAHYGLRTRHHKLIHYYADILDTGRDEDVHDVEREQPSWELFDLRKDPFELHSVLDDPDYADILATLSAQLDREQAAVGDRRYDPAIARQFQDARHAARRAEESRMVRDWRVIGPFPARADGHSLDTPVGLEAAVVAGRPLAVEAPAVDLRAIAGARGFVDLDQVLGRHEHAIAYAVYEWREPQARTATLGCGSDDGVRCWLDGRELLAVDRQRAYRVAEDRVPVTLAPGPHRLVLKIINYTGGWGFGVQLA
jgi:arylsulfatase A-like enzyme